MFEVFEHTADLGLRVRAGSLPALFSEAARGLCSLIVENPAEVRSRASLDITLTARNTPDLLFDWLAELLYLFDARRMVFGQFDVTLDGNSLRATVHGEAFDPARHRLTREIKAITYHGLSVRRDGPQWVAEVIVDI